VNQISPLRPALIRTSRLELVWAAGFGMRRGSGLI
jgi:hypothetical protein